MGETALKFIIARSRGCNFEVVLGGKYFKIMLFNCKSCEWDVTFSGVFFHFFVYIDYPSLWMFRLSSKISCLIRQIMGSFVGSSVAKQRGFRALPITNGIRFSLVELQHIITFSLSFGSFLPLYSFPRSANFLSDTACKNRPVL